MTMEDNFSDFKETFCRLCEEKSGSGKFKDYQIEVINDVHLLNDILDNKLCDLPCLLVCRFTEAALTEDIENGDDTASESKAEDTPSRSISKSELLEGSPLRLQEFGSSLAGSPLKMRMFSTTSVSSSRAGHTVVPVTADEARMLVDAYTLVCEDMLSEGHMESVLPLWVVSDAQDLEHLAVIASHVMYDKTTDSCKIAQFTTTLQGTCDKNILPKPLVMQKEHCWRSDSEMVNTQCSAQYDIFGTSEGKNKSDAEHQGSLIIRLFWDDLKPMLTLPPLDAKAFVDVTVVPGDGRSAAHGLYLEFSTLLGLVGGLKDGCIQFSATEHEVPLLTRVNTLIEDMKQGDANRAADDANDGDELRNLVLNERKDLDFTEKLWNIMKDCSSYQELVGCLERVLNSLQHGEFQPMVNKSNKSQLASMVRDSYYDKLVMPSLTGVKPLEILVEIGIEKLSRDYMDALIGKDLVTHGHMEYFVQTLSLDQVDRVERLERLHHAVELAVILEQFFRLPRPVIGTSTRQALKHFENHTSQEHHVFTIPVQTNNIVGLIESTQASVWKVDMNSKTDHGEVHTVYLLTRKPTLSHVPEEHNQTEDDVADDATMFYLTTVKQSISVL